MDDAVYPKVGSCRELLRNGLVAVGLVAIEILKLRPPALSLQDRSIDSQLSSIASRMEISVHKRPTRYRPPRADKSTTILYRSRS